MLRFRFSDNIIFFRKSALVSVYFNSFFDNRIAVGNFRSNMFCEFIDIKIKCVFKGNVAPEQRNKQAVYLCSGYASSVSSQVDNNIFALTCKDNFFL